VGILKWTRLQIDDDGRPSSYWGLLTASGVCSLIALDTNIVAVSLPSVARDFGVGFADIEWVISAYMLAFASLLLPAGSIADRYGRKPTLLVGLAIFILASLACGAAPTVLVLEIARAVKGVGAALLLTAALATIGHSFSDEQERARAWAFWGTCMGVTITVAPAIGGLITSTAGWRWIFYLNLPVGGLLALMVCRHVPPSRNTEAARLDRWGSLLFASSLFSLISGLIGANRLGWGAPQTACWLLAGVLLLVLFVVAERAQAQPMVDLALFRHARFVGALLGMAAYAACCQSMMTLLPFYLQNGLDFSAMQAGLGMFPFAASMLVFPRVGARLSRRLTPAAMMALGLGMSGAGNLLGAFAAGNGGYPAFALAMIVTGAGAGLLNGDTQKNIMACVPPQRSGMASGIGASVRFSAIMMALGVYGTLLGGGTAAALAKSLHGWGPVYLARAQCMASRVVAGDLRGALAAVAPGDAPALTPLLHQAFASGFVDCLYGAGILALAASAAVGLLMRSPLPAARTA
jgi:EmrB/QacA subfamily drug resistance transporter